MSASPMIWSVESTSIARHWLTALPRKYDVKRLVYFEAHGAIMTAIQREKNIKHWSREWKIDLIVSMNADWRDLYDDIVR